MALTKAQGPFSVGIDDNATATEVTIDTSGNVGIGTDSPASVLELYNATQPALTLGSTSGKARVETFGNDLYITADSDNSGASNLIFRNAGATERMRIDSSGNVGIGDTNPSSERLCLAGASAGKSGIRMRRTDVGTGTGSDGFVNINDAGELQLYRGSEGGAGSSRSIRISAASNDGNIIFNTNGVGGERMRIDASGNLLVGVDSIRGNVQGFAFEPSSGSFGGSSNFLHSTANVSGSGYIGFYYNDGVIGSINQNGTTGVTYNTTSDERLKDNITDAPAGNIDSIKVRSFDWKADGAHQDYGFIAQELDEAAPYAVTKGKTEEDMWAVDYSKLVPMLVKEIQDLKAEVKFLREGV
jgi:hypothetical protein